MLRYRKLINNDEAGLLGFFIPITAMFAIVLLFHMLSKVGMDIPGPLLEPVFNLWLVFVGILLALCAYMRQFLILVLASVISFVATVIIYVMYVI